MSDEFKLRFIAPPPEVAEHPERRGLTPRTPSRAPRSAFPAHRLTPAHRGTWIAVYPHGASGPDFTALVVDVETLEHAVRLTSREPEDGALQYWDVGPQELVAMLDPADLIPLQDWPGEAWPEESRGGTVAAEDREETGALPTPSAARDAASVGAIGATRLRLVTNNDETRRAP